MARERATINVDIWERPTWLYRAYAISGELIYVGISQDWKARLEGHRKYSEWWQYMQHVEIQEYANRRDAFAAESWDIAESHPPFNYEEQVAHVPGSRPPALVAFSRRIRRWTSSGKEIPVKEYP